MNTTWSFSPKPGLRNILSCLMLLFSGLAAGAQTAASAASALQAKADAITKIEVKRTERTQILADGKTRVDFDVRAYDIHGNEVKLTHVEANELLKCKLDQKPLRAGGPDVLREAPNLFVADNGRNLWRTTATEASGSAELAVGLSEKYAAGRKVSGKVEVLVADAIVGHGIVSHVAPRSAPKIAKEANPRPVVPAKQEAPARSNSWGSVKKVKQAVKDHPYIAAGAGGAAVVLGAVALGGGGGGGSSDRGAGAVAGDVSRYAGSISGGISGTSGGHAIANSFTMSIDANGGVTFTSGWGTGYGSINEHGAVSGEGFSGTVTRSGNTLHGSGGWAIPTAGGGWSGSGAASK